jgi:hypothetical protein
MPSFLSQNQQEYPLSLFLSYLYTRKSKEKRGNQKEYDIPIVIPMSFGLNIGLSDSVHLHPLSLSSDSPTRRSINGGEYSELTLALSFVRSFIQG